MKEIHKSFNGGTAALTAYIPAPCRGIVTGLKVAVNKTVAVDDTVDIQRGSTSVNLMTVGSGNTGAGVLLAGTRDATNKELIFDPNGATAAEKVLKLVISALESASTLVDIWIQYDDSALTDQNS